MTTAAGPTRVGVLLWSQATDWQPFLAAARLVDRLGYAHLWTWDHLLPIFGSIDQPILEGWTTLGALAIATERAEIGLLVGANTFRNPALVARSAVTLDHISGGRAVLGLGAGWFEPEHEAFGVDPGRDAAQRLAWLEEAAGIVRALLDGVRVDHDGARYRVRDLTLVPRPVRPRLPLVIGGVGERMTLRTVARHADRWNAYGSPQELRHKVSVLWQHCERERRDPMAIEMSIACKPFIRDGQAAAERVLARALERNRTPAQDIAADASFWVGSPSSIAERMLALREIGFSVFIAQLPAPYDDETIERFIGEVVPLVDQELDLAVPSMPHSAKEAP